MITRIEKGYLPSEEKWNKYINSLKTKSSDVDLKTVLLEAVKKRIPEKHFGIFFSGGVDSTFLAFVCKRAKADFTCYSVGLKGAPDLEWAEKIAQEWRLKHKIKEHTLEEAESIIKKTASMFDKVDVIKIGVGAVEVACAGLGLKDGTNVFFGGLGSEEIFAGYERHVRANNINEECWKGLKGMWGRDFTRDFTIAKKMNISLLIPFLDENVILSAMKIPGSLKIREGYKKHILRQIADDLGMQKEFCWRKKKAAQYGSGFDNALEKLAKKENIGKRQYVESLINDGI